MKSVWLTSMTWSNENEMPVIDEEEWTEVSAKPKVSAKPLQWCRFANACRGNCGRRHERCTHYDAWVARGRKGVNCRHAATDPKSEKSPQDGGCKYDHGERAQPVIVERVENPYGEFLEMAARFGLELIGSTGGRDHYSTANVSETDKSVLGKWLVNSGLKVESCEKGRHQFAVLANDDEWNRPVRETCAGCRKSFVWTPEGVTGDFFRAFRGKCYGCHDGELKTILAKYSKYGVKKSAQKCDVGEFIECKAKDANWLSFRREIENLAGFCSYWATESNEMWVGAKFDGRVVDLRDDLAMLCVA